MAACFASTEFHLDAKKLTGNAPFVVKWECLFVGAFAVPRVIGGVFADDGSVRLLLYHNNNINNNEIRKSSLFVLHFTMGREQIEGRGRKTNEQQEPTTNETLCIAEGDDYRRV
jgi:hypothetical protein